MKRKRIIHSYNRITVDMRFGKNSVKGDTLRSLSKRSSVQELNNNKRKAIKKWLNSKGD